MTTLWRAAEPLVLASKSAIRRTVLTAAGIPVEVQATNIDERALQAQSNTHDPSAVATLLARAKAQAVARRMPARLVLGADQTLALGDRSFTKPENRTAARDQLRDLRGRTHTLHSAIAVVLGDAVSFETCAVARLTMRAFSDAFIESYLDQAGDAATASVGGYQLEGLGIHLFERIEGDHFTILGLPLLPLLDWLRQAGYLAR